MPFFVFNSPNPSPPLMEGSEYPYFLLEDEQIILNTNYFR